MASGARCRVLTPAERKIVHRPTDQNAGAGWHSDTPRRRSVDDTLDDFETAQSIAEFAEGFTE